MFNFMKDPNQFMTRVTDAVVLYIMDCAASVIMIILTKPLSSFAPNFYSGINIFVAVM
jgi:hypothetical protein